MNHDDILCLLRKIERREWRIVAVGWDWERVAAGNVRFRVLDGPWTGVEMIVFNDSMSWDYLDSMYLPDGSKVYEFSSYDEVGDWRPDDESAWVDAPEVEA